jgi:hypothetical protein
MENGMNSRTLSIIITIAASVLSCPVASCVAGEAPTRNPAEGVSTFAVPPLLATMNGGISNVIDYSNPGLRPGRGYDAVNGEPKGECITFETQKPFSAIEWAFETKK